MMCLEIGGGRDNIQVTSIPGGMGVRVQGGGQLWVRVEGVAWWSGEGG